MNCLVTGSTATVGHGISNRQAFPTMIPLGVDRVPRVWLYTLMTLEPDRDGKHLQVTRGMTGLYSGPNARDDDQLIFVIDFVREPGNEYPECHIHVGGRHTGLAAIYEGAPNKGRALRDLHLPVGGKRFRPTLEDVIEFTIVEEMAVPHDGWQAALDEHRHRWMRLQAKAVARRFPDEAAEALKAQGWRLQPPTKGNRR